jgi:acetylornithine deacetylase/succinyl-diaminopimelate desuccinylase-like protein
MNAAEIVARHFEGERDRILAQWFELLRFPTVSAQRERLGDCARCAAWLRRYLKALGFEVEVCPGEGPPILLAERAATAAGAPAVLFYGHYDVQPADPPEQWRRPPFEPELREDRVYARGAQDNKGQFFAFLEGMTALIRAGRPLPAVRIVLDGEEESGSPTLQARLPRWRRRLAADVLLVCDTGMHPSGRPAITAGLRGIVHLSVRLEGPRRDLHSGAHGGLAPNCALQLARLLATLHDDDGRIAVAGFHDRIEAPTAREEELARALPFDAEAYERETGVPPVGGEADVEPALRAGFRPAIEVNGLAAGHAGPGFKTVIPAAATAKLTARLVPGQNPERALAAIIAHLRARAPRGLRLEIPEAHVGGAAFRLPLDTPLVRLATRVLTRLDARGPLFLWEGASVPVIALLREQTGAAPLLVGFGREDDCIHAPDESFSLEQFLMAMRYSGEILSELAVR